MIGGQAAVGLSMAKMLGGVVRLVFAIGLIGATVYVAPKVIESTRSTAAPTARPAAAMPPALATGIATINKALVQAQQSGRAVEISIKVTDADLTAAAASYFPQSFGGIMVSDPTVKLGSGKMDLTAKASIAFGKTQLLATATPLVSAGKLAVRLDSAAVGGVALPDAARAQLQQQLQAALDLAVPPKLQVSTVTVGQGEVTISGSALP